MGNEIVTTDDQRVVHRFFDAMQAAGTKEKEMMQLFAEDAVYVEPFSGVAREHVGKAAIRDAMVAGWKHPLPDMRVEVERITTDGRTLLVDWVCYSPALPGGRGAGTNAFTLRSGLIVRLETRLKLG